MSNQLKYIIFVFSIGKVEVRKNQSNLKLQAMKTILFSVLMAFATMNAFGQVYHPLVTEGKIWSTFHDICKTPNNDYYSNFTKFEGDFTINDTLYKKFWTCKDTVNNSWEQFGFIREDSSRRVWYRYSTNYNERLVYDFGVVAGDSVQSSYPDEQYYYVDSIDSIQLLNGEYRKQFHISCSYDGETWIEGVGSLEGVNEGMTCGYVGDTPRLICMLDHGDLLYHNDFYQECHYISGINDKENSVKQIVLQPNPASGQVTIITKGFAGSKIRVMDIQQREVMSVESEVSDRTVIDISEFAPGIYFVETGGVVGRLTVFR
jgi:hypothetical protein